MRYLCAVVVLVSSLLLGIGGAEAADAAIHNGSKVAFAYTLTVDGKVVDTSQGGKPLEYTQGDGKMIPGLTRQLEGMKAGDEKAVVLKPEEAYGSPNPAAIREVPLSQLPSQPKPQVGMILRVQNKQGQVFPARIADVKGDKALVDMNHPLAGKTLNFKIKIVSVT